MKKNRTLRYVIYVLIFVLTLALDQISKILTDHGGHEGSYAVIPGLINFMSVYNEGASFSLFAGKPWAQDFFTVLTAIVLAAGAVYIVFTKKQSKWLGVTIALLFSGTIGNFIDRLAFKYVRDFISFAFFKFPTFNVADCCLCVGVAMLVIYLLFIDDEAVFGSKEDKQENKTVAEAAGAASATNLSNAGGAANGAADGGLSGNGESEADDDKKLKAKSIAFVPRGTSEKSKTDGAGVKPDETNKND